MANHEVVETVYGKHNKYEVVRVSKPLGGYDFNIYKNGEYHRGSFSSLARAVEVAKKEK
jgi:hypothetical protein